VRVKFAGLLEAFEALARASCAQRAIATLVVDTASKGGAVDLERADLSRPCPPERDGVPALLGQLATEAARRSLQESRPN
jgi:hypothetical protein